MVAAPVPPERPAQVLRRPQDLVARPGACRVQLPGPRISAGRNDRRCSARRDGVMAGAGVIGVASGARTGGASAGNSAVTLAISSSAGIWASRSGSIGASPTLLDVTSTARISNVCSSIPRWILRHTRRFEQPCLRVCHSPSPSTLMPVLSMSWCSGPLDPQYGMVTSIVRRAFAAPLAPRSSLTLAPGQGAEIRH